MQKVGVTIKPTSPDRLNEQNSTADAQLRSTTSTLSNEYEFVSGTLVDAATLERAVGLAQQWNVTPHDVLIANGWVRPNDYYRALARDCGAEFIGQHESASLAPFSQIATPREALRSQLLRRVRKNRVDVAYAPGAARPGELKRRLAVDVERIAITSPRELRATIQRTFAKRLSANAIHSLTNRFPGESAGEGLVMSQRYGLTITFTAICLSGFLSPVITLHVVAGIATLYFGMVVALRLVACINAIISIPLNWMRRSPPRIADAELPIYTLLVPLFRESAVLEELIRALMRLDYPAAKLDIKLIFESVDT